MERGEDALSRPPPAPVGLGQEPLTASASPRLVADPVLVRREDALGAGGLEHPSRPVHAGADVADVEVVEPVVEHRLAVAVDPHLALAAVPQQHADGRQVGQLLHQVVVLARLSPGRIDGEDAGVERRRLQFHAVTGVEIDHLVGVDRLHHALPRADLLFEHPGHAGHGMEPEVAADVEVVEPRTS